MKTRTLLAICIPALIVSGLLALGSGAVLTDVFGPNGDRIDAWTQAKSVVSAQLKSPNSAEFESLGWKRVEKKAPDVFLVKGWVDSKNDFGAMTRADFECTMRHDADGGWSYADLAVNSR